MKSLLFFVFFTFACFGQSEQITSYTAGAGGVDYTLQPIGAQSEFSKSQTLYYPNEIQFRGTITEIRYVTSFSNISLTNSNVWSVKIGTTSLPEFNSSIPFIDSSLLTEVFNGTIVMTSNEVIITFSQPFYYNGIDNLIIEVTDLAPGFTSSLISGFKGVENFNNPPTRSKMIFYGSTPNDSANENSYPITKFNGSLERCILPNFSGGITEITQTSASVNLSNNPQVTGYEYAIYQQELPMPSTLTSTTQNTILFSNLLPAQIYKFACKTNCDDPVERFASTKFTTKPLVISVPHQINFDGVNTRDYLLPEGFLGQAFVSDLANNNSLNGILFRGSLDALQANIWSDFDIWNNNTEFISKASFIIDLTNNPVNPVFTFDLKQKSEAYFRVKINNLVKTITFTSITGGDVDFDNIVIDLSEYVGQIINLDLEGLSRFSGTQLIRTNFVDSIELKSATCISSVTDFNTSATEDSITISANDLSVNYDVAIIAHSSELTDDNWTTVTLPYTFSNLEIASPYRIYIRKKCGAENSPFYEIFESTLTSSVTVPFIEFFNPDEFTNFFVPKYNASSNVTINTVSNFVNLHQIEKGKQWFGGINTTESQAWNENKDFVSELRFRVDATNLSSLTMVLNYRLARYFPANSSWFRIVINGAQFGPSRVPNTLNSDPFQNYTYDLSAFVGSEVSISLQHSGRETSFSNGGVNDAAYISLVELSGTLSNPEFLEEQLVVYPNPSSDFITIKNVSNVDFIKLFSIDGKELYKVNCENSSDKIINIENLSKGIYFLQFYQKDKSFYKTIQKN
jgi:Secretion system C-terminal sorting domain